MKDQPLSSGCDIHEAVVSVGLSAPPAGYTAHTLSPPDILYKMPSDVWCAPYYLHLLPTEKTIYIRYIGLIYYKYQIYVGRKIFSNGLTIARQFLL
jgi:hypothetical protein